MELASGEILPAWQPGMRPDFHRIHKLFNVLHTPIQDLTSYEQVVNRLAAVASNDDELEALLRQHRREQFQRLEKEFHRMGAEFLMTSSNCSSENEWDLGVRLFRTKSFSALVEYLHWTLPKPAGRANGPASSKPSQEPKQIPTPTSSPDRSVDEDISCKTIVQKSPPLRRSRRLLDQNKAIRYRINKPQPYDRHRRQRKTCSG